MLIRMILMANGINVLFFYNSRYGSWSGGDWVLPDLQSATGRQI